MDIRENVQISCMTFVQYHENLGFARSFICAGSKKDHSEKYLLKKKERVRYNKKKIVIQGVFYG